MSIKYDKILGALRESDNLSVPEINSQANEATILALYDRLKAAEPCSRYEISVPMDSYMLSINLISAGVYPEYTDIPENFIAYLETLGSLDISWGDGTSTTFFYRDSEFGPPSHIYTYSGIYKISIMTNRCFPISEIATVLLLRSMKYIAFDNPLISVLPEFSGIPSSVQMISLVNCVSLWTLPSFSTLASLQLLALINCASLVIPPNLIGLTELHTLQMDSCGNLTQPPILTGLTALQSLYMINCPSLVTPPDLTGLTALINVSFGNCISFNTMGVDTVLGYFSVNYPNLSYVDLMCGYSPSPGLLTIAQAANPQATFFTS